ncbi:MAG: hypothetical protein HQK53_10945 [Oligoflexia bacterium]|nr:hypothetical protein [Oligoflexia bacterium]
MKNNNSDHNSSGDKQDRSQDKSIDNIIHLPPTLAPHPKRKGRARGKIIPFRMSTETEMPALASVATDADADKSTDAIDLTKLSLPRLLVETRNVATQVNTQLGQLNLSSQQAVILHAAAILRELLRRTQDLPLLRQELSNFIEEFEKNLALLKMQ